MTEIKVNLISHQKLEGLNSKEKIRFILKEVEKGEILVLEKGLSAEEQAIIGARDFDQFLNRIIHDWLKTLTLLVITLVPLFFVLDYFIVPKDLLKQVGIYRLIATFIVSIQYLIIRITKPTP